MALIQNDAYTPARPTLPIKHPPPPCLSQLIGVEEQWKRLRDRIGANVAVDCEGYGERYPVWGVDCEAGCRRLVIYCSFL